MTKLMDDYTEDADGSQSAEVYAEQVALAENAQFKFRERVITLLERITHLLAEDKHE
tara:strand:+ start:475 stop:645 length:171 start_codon:yes stop_codon:yes gene_type:complete